MPQPQKERSASGHYDANYRNFEAELYAEIRREAFGEDIGQSGWISAEEQNRFIPALGLCRGKRLLDIACGSGGPALRIAEKTQCGLVGIDLHEQAVSTARSLASQRTLAEPARFQVADAAERLPFQDNSFHAITCIDSINHLPDRPRLISEWARVLKPGGRLLFTNPTTISGPLTKEEIATRASIGFFLFVPVDYDRKVIADCGLELLVHEDVTANMAKLAGGRFAARAARHKALREIEGDESFEAQQRFLEVASRLAKERCLSRFLYVAAKPPSID